jgi:uncharacterized protein (DUF2235 family)
MSNNIVVCCDGTGNEYCEKKTNVSKLFEMIDKKREDHIVYYDPGVGTIGSAAALSRPGKWFTRLLGLAFAAGLTRNIEEAYEFLMEYYTKGDRVFLFGFSRGAYTVRALAGMLIKCGLLHPIYKNQIPYASKLYRNYYKKYGKQRINEFRETFSRNCIPYMIGVWDTVKSTGLFGRYEFRDFILNTEIKFGYHALAVDEKRSKFAPVLWEKQSGSGDQTIEQVWFPGVHCDVGGSYTEDGLSNIALQWIVEKARALGLKIKDDVLAKYPPDYKDKKHRSYKGFWIPLLPKTREIKEGVTVHECTYRKIDLKDGYHPKNLPPREKMKITGSQSECE